MGCCSGCGCGSSGGRGLGSSSILGITTLAVAGIIGISVLGFTSDDKDKKEQPPASPTPTPSTTPPAAQPAPAPAPKPNPYVLGFTMNDIDGKPQDLAQYKGKVILMVNVASECGFTKQYTGLQALYEAKKDKGLVILGFPANNFGGQEPGDDKAIKDFCTNSYKVTFPMFAKISVKGDDAAPLYKTLTAVAGEPGWNFNKYLVDKSGNVVERFESRIKPDDAAFLKRIDLLLEAK